MADEDCDVNYSEPGTCITALHEIALTGRRQELRIIVKRDDLSFNVRTSKGYDPAFLASIYGDDPVMERFLLKKQLEEIHRTGADIIPSPFGDISLAGRAFE